MPKMVTYNKLVRDKIPERIRAIGEAEESRFAVDDEEYWSKLKDKLREEVDEFIEKESLKELADITEVLYAICRFKAIEKEELLRIRKKRLRERGGFDERIILIASQEYEKRD